MYLPSRSSTILFKQWLVDCHRFLDKDSYFYTRMHEEERLCRAAQQSFTSALFKHLDLGTDIKLKTGDRVKLLVGKERRLTKKKYINVEIVAFEADLGPGVKETQMTAMDADTSDIYAFLLKCTIRLSRMTRLTTKPSA